VDFSWLTSFFDSFAVWHDWIKPFWEATAKYLGAIKQLVGVVGLGLAAVLILAGISKGWRFLARYHYDGGILGYVRTVPRLWLTLKADWRFRGIRSPRAARYLTEFEILDPRPTKPRRWGYATRAEWRDATEKWKPLNKDWKNQRAHRFRKLIENKDESTESLQRFSQPERLDRLSIIPIANPAVLDNSRTSIARYFVIATEFKADSSDTFLSYVQLNDGYFAPLFLISGLMTRFNEDWQPIINNYRDQLEGQDKVSGDLLELASFEFNCWLLWGPSVSLCSCGEWQTAYGQNHGTADPLFYQYGFGDENNSIDVAIKNGRTPDFVNKTIPRLIQPSHHRSKGGQVRAASASLYGQIKLGTKRPIDQTCRAQQIISHPDDGRLYLEHNEFVDTAALDKWLARPPERVKPKRWWQSRQSSKQAENPPSRGRQESGYYSAYIWVMFVVSDRDGKPLYDQAQWKNLLPFFEHGNIADATTMRTFKECLVAKACKALKEILGRREDEQRGIAIRYACAFDHSNCGSPLLFPLSSLSIFDLLKAEVASDPILQAAQNAGRIRLSGDSGNPYCSCNLPAIVGQFYTVIDDANKKRNARASPAKVISKRRRRRVLPLRKRRRSVAQGAGDQ
jgi:hypothetical protein